MRYVKRKVCRKELLLHLDLHLDFHTPGPRRTPPLLLQQTRLDAPHPLTLAQ